MEVLFKQKRQANCNSVFWLLEELVIYSTQFRCETGPQAVQKTCEAGVATLGRLVNMCGPPIWTIRQR